MMFIPEIGAVYAISEGGSSYAVALCLLAFFLFLLVALMVHRAIIVIQPHQQGVYILLGKPKRLLMPGLNLVSPIMRSVIIADMREQEIPVEEAEYETKDYRKIILGLTLYVRITDPMKAVFNVKNYKTTLKILARTHMRVAIQEMEKEEITDSKNSLEAGLAESLNRATGEFGVAVNRVVIKEPNRRKEVDYGQREDYEALYQTGIRRR